MKILWMEEVLRQLVTIGQYETLVQDFLQNIKTSQHPVDSL